MILERYMVTAERVDNGERVMGYYIYGNNDVECEEYHVLVEHVYHCADYCDELTARFHNVNPLTIEPVAVKVVNIMQHEYDPNVFCGECPNCDAKIQDMNEVDHIDLDLYNCRFCGQRLDWSE